MARKEYKRRHDNVTKKVHWDICKKNGSCSGRSIREWRDQSTVRQKYPVWQSHRGKTTWPNSYWQERTKWDNYSYYVPADVRVEEKDKENVEKYQDLKKEIKRLWKLRNVEIVLVVIGALGTVSAEFDRWMVKLGITFSVGVMQKTALLVTARILKKVLDRRNDGNNSSQNINVKNK